MRNYQKTLIAVSFASLTLIFAELVAAATIIPKSTNNSNLMELPNQLLLVKQDVCTVVGTDQKPYADVYQSPKSSSSVIGTLARGSAVNIQQTSGGWVYVSASTSGWVWRALLKC